MVETATTSPGVSLQQATVTDVSEAPGSTQDVTLDMNPAFVRELIEESAAGTNRRLLDVASEHTTSSSSNESPRRKRQRTAETNAKLDKLVDALTAFTETGSVSRQHSDAELFLMARQANMSVKEFMEGVRAVGELRKNT